MGLFHRAHFVMSVLLLSGSYLGPSSYKTTCSSVGSPLGSSVSTICLLLYWLSTSYSFLQATLTYSNSILPELRRDTLCHYGLHHGLQGNLCSDAWHTTSPSFSDLGAYRASSTCFTHFSHSCYTVLFTLFKISYCRGNAIYQFRFDQQWSPFGSSRKQLGVT